MSEMNCENHGKKWTVKETKQLLKETRKIDDLNKIALIHKRTPYAIYLKLVKEASKIADEDYEINLEDLAEIVGLKPQSLLDGFKKIKFDFIDREDNSDSDYIYNKSDDDDTDTEISEQEVNDIIQETKKEDEEQRVEILPTWTSIAIITINLAGIYYFLIVNKLI
jgi:hypothetical protein